MTKEVLDTLRKQQSLSIEIVKTKADVLAVCLAFIFDFNFKYSFQFLKKSKYMDIIIDKMKEKARPRESPGRR